MEYPIVVLKLSKRDGGGYLGYAVDLRGCMSDGETPEEALKNTRDAVLEWIDTAKKLKRAIPKPHSAMERNKQERATMVKALKQTTQMIENLDAKIEKLRKDLDDIQGAQDDRTNWDKFILVADRHPEPRRIKRLYVA